MSKKLTKDQFINRSNVIHNNKYDYSMVEYVNSYTKVKIICPIHGIFEQTPKYHLDNCGCAKCGGNVKLTTKYFIEKSKEIHGDKYDYSLVKYKNNKTKVKIICPIHGIFEQIPNSHLLGKNCIKCGHDLASNKRKQKIEEFINRSNYIHNNKYDYSLVEYSGIYTKIKIICPTHGIFEQIPNDHTKGVGCPKCKSSKGEKEIIKILENNNIKYESQKKFNNCKYKRKLSFDFYLPIQNICIEYDGRQHFQSIEYFGGDEEFKNRQLKDNIKNEYCKNNNIKLIRINENENIHNLIDLINI